MIEKKDNNFFNFKKNIGSVIDILDIINTDDKKVLRIINRWWKKYRLSMEEVDIELKKLEDEFQKEIKEFNDE